MPIDKIIPRFLVSDEDERLLKEGAMTDALNVTISENGDGTEGVIKNVRGTIACTPDDGSELSDNEPDCASTSCRTICSTVERSNSAVDIVMVPSCVAKLLRLCVVSCASHVQLHACGDDFASPILRDFVVHH